MSVYSRHLAWEATCMDRGAYGATAGDSFMQGLRDYNQLRPYPNGLPLDSRQPQDCEHWRRRVEKAKRDIYQWNRDISVEQRSEAITDDEFDVWFDFILKGQHEHGIEC